MMMLMLKVTERSAVVLLLLLNARFFGGKAETDLVESCSNMMIPTLVNGGHARRRHIALVWMVLLCFSFLVG
jgi:hypothetical protein